MFYLWHGLDVPLVYGVLGAVLAVDGVAAGHAGGLKEGDAHGALLVPPAQELKQRPLEIFVDQTHKWLKQGPDLRYLRGVAGDQFRRKKLS